MAVSLFALTVAAEGSTVLLVAFSIAFPRRRIWPPPRKRSWQGPTMGLLFIVCALGVLALGVADWNRLGIPSWIRFGVGVPLAVAGNGLALWALAALGLAASFGQEGALVRKGPYRFSRHPQYVGFIVALAGWAFLAASSWTAAAALGGVAPLVLAPFAEEPWLRGQHGAAYEEYVRAVPRFIGFRRPYL
jgi:protein-S-isoprenylcysteine O-methyltransferase Ste14